MSVFESLPLLVPVCGLVLAISTSTFCCLRRQMTARFNRLEDRVFILERQIQQQKSALDPQPVAAQTQNFVPPYTNYQQPSAPYMIQQPYGQYPAGTVTYAI